MVDLALLQSISYMAGALGVCVGALSFAFNMRASQRNMKQTLETRKLQFINEINKNLISEESLKRWITLLNMEWMDYDDFQRKYGSDVDIDNCAKRMAMWYSYDNIGAMLRSGLVDAETLYDSNMFGGFEMWVKFEGIIREGRIRYNTPGDLVNFEYLAKEMLRIRLLRDPSFKQPETFLKYVPDK
ncbi:MAG: hypothetical protein NTY03_02010 [Candidatus Bathyarchaeota archaeon]|nr:hypothetical protein [Candidatus Bathyarchaeota archaeon]